MIFRTSPKRGVVHAGDEGSRTGTQGKTRAGVKESALASMDPEYETCRANFELLAAYYVDAECNRNEATTRLQLIDRLFFECLGWSREANIELEQPQDGEYADYTFLAPRRIMIVE